jgi:hypothetical protein
MVRIDFAPGVAEKAGMAFAAVFGPLAQLVEQLTLNQ